MTTSPIDGRPIRVLMVMPSYYPVVGGMEIQIARQIPFLREHGIDVAILTRRTAGTARVEQHDGVEIRRVSIPGGPGLRSIAFTMLGTADIVRNRRDIDLIHAHSILSPTTIAAIAGVPLRKPRIVTLHQSYEPEHLLNKPLGKQRIQLYRRIITRFVSISCDIERLLLLHDIPSSKTVSIPNGIDTHHFAPATASEKVALRARLDLPQEQAIAVFVGRLQAVKQVDVLLRAWSAVTGGRLLILGDGDQRQALSKLATTLNVDRRVEFRGMVPNVAEFLRAADIFVLPSASEGLSVALLEAMSSGLVPIATSVGGSVDLIRDRESGLLVRSGDVDGLRAALTFGLTATEWRQNAALQARRQVVTGYDLRVVAAMLARVYREALAGSRR